MQSENNSYYNMHNVDCNNCLSSSVITSLYLCLYVAAMTTESFLPSNCCMGYQFCAKEAEWLSGVCLRLLDRHPRSNVTGGEFVLLRCMTLNMMCEGHCFRLVLSHIIELFLGIRRSFGFMV